MSHLIHQVFGLTLSPVAVPDWGVDRYEVPQDSDKWTRMARTFLSRNETYGPDHEHRYLRIFRQQVQLTFKLQKNVGGLMRMIAELPQDKPMPKPCQALILTFIGRENKSVLKECETPAAFLNWTKQDPEGLMKMLFGEIWIGIRNLPKAGKEEWNRHRVQIHIANYLWETTGTRYGITGDVQLNTSIPHPIDRNLTISYNDIPGLNDLIATF